MLNHLRIGILVDDKHRLLNWEQKVIVKLQEITGVEIAAMIIVPAQATVKEKAGLKLFRRFENWWFRSVPDAFKQMPFESKGIEIIDYSEKEKLKRLNLDVIYQSYGVGIVPDLDAYAKYGTWYLSFGHGIYKRSTLPGFWEVMNREKEIGSSLFVKRAGKDPEAIVLGTTTTVPFSVKNTRSMIAWKSTSYFIYRIKGLMSVGPEQFFSRNNATGSSIADDVTTVYTSPGNFQMSYLFSRNVCRYLFYKIRKLFNRKRFSILVSNQGFSLDGIRLDKFADIPMPKGAVWADPFLVEEQERKWIFFEESYTGKDKAHISVFEYVEGVATVEAVKVIDRPYHLSYPFTFKIDGTYYMIPESSGNRTVELYKCLDFPFKWEFVKNLMTDTELIDPTLLYHNSMWWLFGTRRDHSFTSTNDQLFLYYSKDLFSADWKFHPQNPIVSIISNCRPAGRIFNFNGKLYRPAQNNASETYGYAIKINEIEILNETTYREREVSEILPDLKRLHAVHHIDISEGFMVIDGVM